MSWAVDAGWQYGGGAGGRPGAPQWERDSVTQAVAETVANRSNVPDVTFVEKFSIFAENYTSSVSPPLGSIRSAVLWRACPSRRPSHSIAIPSS